MRELLLLAALLLAGGAAAVSTTDGAELLDVTGLGFTALGLLVAALLVGDGRP